MIFKNRIWVMLDFECNVTHHLYAQFFCVCNNQYGYHATTSYGSNIDVIETMQLRDYYLKLPHSTEKVLEFKDMLQF